MARLRVTRKGAIEMNGFQSYKKLSDIDISYCYGRYVSLVCWLVVVFGVNGKTVGNGRW